MTTARAPGRTRLMRGASLVPLAIGVAALLSCSEQPAAPLNVPPNGSSPAPPGAKLVFTTQPTNTTAGVAITPAVAVAIQDASGTVITSATGVVTIGSVVGSAGLSGTTSVNAVNGVATFPDLSIERAGSGYSLVAVVKLSPALTSAPSASFAVVPAAPSILAMGGSSPVETTRPFAVGVRISDAFGNSVPSTATDAVTLSLGSNPGGATLAGTLTVPLLGGEAVFANLTLDRPGLDYVLQATSGQLRGSMKLDVWNRDAFAAVSAGGAHTCARARDGYAYCWGANGSGQVGAGTTVDYSRPVIVASVTTTVSAGSSHTCAIATGRLYCWGLNDDGQLGDGSKTTRLSPTPTIAAPAAVSSVITGGSHTCGTSNQDPWDYGETTTCWGNDVQGQLGDLRNTPSVVALVAGGSHTCGTDFGSPPSLYCWGSNERGQLGIGTSIQFLRTPLRVASFDANGSLAAGGSHTCASLTVGSISGLFCWGLNDDGQLGDGTTVQRTSPVLVRGAPFSSVTAGAAHTCALTSAGAAYCWGANDHGQIGDATTTKRTNPVVVAGGLTFVSLSAGGRHTCGVTVGGTYCWGANGNGQLGNGTTTDSAVPVRVSGQ